MGVKKNIDSVKYKKAIDFSYNFYQESIEKVWLTLLICHLLTNLIIENNGTTDEAIAGLSMIFLSLV